MYRMLKAAGLRSASRDEFVSLVVALLVAERWFRWHSFALEACGFLATWTALDWCVLQGQQLVSRLRSRWANDEA